jgi:hypothetical protein
MLSNIDSAIIMAEESPHIVAFYFAEAPESSGLWPAARNTGTGPDSTYRPRAAGRRGKFAAALGRRYRQRAHRGHNARPDHCIALRTDHCADLQPVSGDGMAPWEWRASGL